MNRCSVFLYLIILGLSVSHAAVTIDVVESGGNVVSTASGSINTAGLGEPNIGGEIGGIIGGSNSLPGFVSEMAVGSTSSSAVYYIGDSTNMFSIGGRFAASSDIGDWVGVGVFSGVDPDDDIFAVNLWVLDSPLSEIPISGTSTWDGHTFASLGLIAGTYIFSWGTDATADSLTLNIISGSAPTYSVGGSVSGLTGTGLELQNDGGDTLAVAAAATDFTFATELLSLAAYAVEVSAQPAGQTCTANNGSGTITDADITNIAINCVDVVVPPIDTLVSADPIPTLSQWALIVLFMLLGLMVFTNRKRLF